MVDACHQNKEMPKFCHPKESPNFLSLKNNSQFYTNRLVHALIRLRAETGALVTSMPQYVSSRQLALRRRRMLYLLPGTSTNQDGGTYDGVPGAKRKSVGTSEPSGATSTSGTNQYKRKNQLYLVLRGLERGKSTNQQHDDDCSIDHVNQRGLLVIHVCRGWSVYFPKYIPVWTKIWRDRWDVNINS